MDPRHEYDAYVASYRTEQNRQLRLSGETGEDVAEYKVAKLRLWLPQFAARPIRVLDYGCGDGLMTSFVRQYFPQATVIGVDSSVKSIEYARTHHGNGIRFESLASNRLPFPDGSMDLVYASGVFHHIPFDKHPAALGEIFRVLAPGGWFALFELNPFNPFSRYVFKTSPFDRNAKLIFPRYARKLLAPYGPIMVKYYAFFPRVFKALRQLEPFLEWLPLGALYATLVRKAARG